MATCVFETGVCFVSEVDITRVQALRKIFLKRFNFECALLLQGSSFLNQLYDSFIHWLYLHPHSAYKY